MAPTMRQADLWERVAALRVLPKATEVQPLRARHLSGALRHLALAERIEGEVQAKDLELIVQIEASLKRLRAREG